MEELWEELKKRSVVRVAIAYVIASWLVLQVADVVLNNFAAPSWIFATILALLGIGLPIALIMSWAFELTPEGLQKESEVADRQATNAVSGKRLDRAIIAILAIAVLFFAADKFLWSGPDAQAPTGTQRNAIAVMPFLNMSADPEQDYMSDGLAEEILNLLVRIPALRVTSRASAFTYKGTDYRTQDVGRELGVDHLLLGSVRRSGDRIRISTQLVDVETDSPVWTESWDRTLDDIFAIQDEVAAAIVDSLKLQLVDAMPVVERTSPEAYALFLQAMSYLNQRSSSSALQAEKLFLDAIDIDPNYLPAQLQLAITYMSGSATGAWHPKESRPKAREIADRVLERDLDNPTALAILAEIAARFDFDHQAANRYLERAVASSPNNPRVQGVLAMRAAFRGDREDAIRIMEEQRAADPLSMNTHYILGGAYSAAGRPEEAELSLRRAIQLSPGGSGVHFYLAMLLLGKGDIDAALKEVELETRIGYQHTGRALIYQTLGDAERATEELDELIALGDRWTYQIAAVHAYLNEPDEAIYWLERAVDRADTSLSIISGDPFMDNIRDDPRFVEILKHVTGVE